MHHCDDFFVVCLNWELTTHKDGHEIRSVKSIKDSFEIIYTSHGRMNPLWNQLNKYHHHQIFSWMWQKPMDCFAWMGTVLIIPEQQNSRKGYQNAARIDGLMQERTPVRSQWIYVFFSLTHGHGVSVMKEPGTISLTMRLYSKFNRNFILFWYQL